MAEPGTIPVEVVLALPERQWLRDLTLPAGTTAREAVQQSGLQAHCPELDLERCALGIWGLEVAGDKVLAAGDRVEIYRPLRRDPRAARRELARRGYVITDRSQD